MSLANGSARMPRLAMAVAGLAVLSLGLSACQVRPLYSAGGATITTNAGQPLALSQVSFKPVSTRYAQVVRNQLIFAFNGGAQRQTQTRYTVDLDITSRTTSAAYVQRADEDEPTAGTVTMRGGYTISDSQTGQVVKAGSRQVFSSYDVSRQAFSAFRAERDAQDRAGRELAELLRLAIIQDLTGPGGAPTVAAPIAPSTPAPGAEEARGFN